MTTPLPASGQTRCYSTIPARNSQHSSQLDYPVQAASVSRASKARVTISLGIFIFMLAITALALIQRSYAQDTPKLASVAVPFQEKGEHPYLTSSPTTVANIGYQDMNFGSEVTEPTARDAQHKLWFNDGIWWASMYNSSPSRQRYEIYRLDMSTQLWATTDTTVDERSGSYADTLWDGTHLYIGSGVYPGRNSNLPVYMNRYSYNSTTQLYTLDTGFPILIDTAAVIAVVIDQDSLGRVWMTYTKPQDPNCVEPGPPSCTRAVFVTHGTTADNSAWVAPFGPPVNNATGLGPDNLSALVPFGGNKIGLLWDHGPYSALYFTFHVDTAPDSQWSPVVTVARKADNHINLAMVESDSSGSLYAVVKNDCNEQPRGCSVNPSATPYVNPNDALIWLFAITSTSVTSYTVSRVQDEQTRPILAVDSQNRQLYVFATTYYSNGTPDGLRAITYKQVNLDNISFPEGKGTTFIQNSASTNINDATTTKQSLNSASGIVVLASDSTSRTYFHNVISDNIILPTFTPTPSSTVVPDASASVTATLSATTTPVVSATITATPVASATASPSVSATSTPTAGASVTITATPSVCAITFTDVPEGSTFYSFVRCLACRGIVNGYACGSPGEPCGSTGDPYFRPNGPVTRGQLSKIVSESAGFSEPVSSRSFEDIPVGSTFYLFVERLSSRGIVGGYACGGPGEPCAAGSLPYFRPNAGATRGQLTKIVSNAAGFADQIPQGQYTFADVPGESTFYIYIERLILNRPGVINGYPCGSSSEPCDDQQRPYFRPGDSVTRGQTSKIVSNTFFSACVPLAGDI